MTSRHALVIRDGLTHASSVIPAVKCNDAASLTVIFAFVPLNTRASPYFPDAVQVAFEIVPVFPFPEASATVVPVPSLKAYAATGLTCAIAGRAPNSNTANRIIPAGTIQRGRVTGQ
jgi:hypothetical protein